MRRIAGFVLSCLALIPVVQAASFDCGKASTTVEKNICSDKELSKLDEKLAAAYRHAIQLTTNKEILKFQQREWLVNTRNTCSDVKCLEAAYIGRLEQIELVVKKADSNFAGEWHLELCDKSISEVCGGFTVYLIQIGKEICGDHFFATPGGGRINEGAPRSIVGSVAGNVANIKITSGRNNAVLRVRAIKNGDVLSWEVVDEIRRGLEGDSALVLEKGNLTRKAGSVSYQEALSACQSR